MPPYAKTGILMSTSETDTSTPLFWMETSLKNPEELLAKAEIVQRISDIIAERKLSQARAAKLLGIDQPKVSALLRGRLEGFSIDRLFRFLNVLGRDVEITIRPARRVEDAGTRVV